jgi:hypothetical protein
MLEQRRHPGLLVVALSLVVASISVDAQAQARTAKPILKTAYTLEAKELQLGIGTQAYGLVDRVTMATLLTGWILPAFTDVFAPNLLFRYRFFDVHRWSLALNAGASWLRIKDANLVGTTQQTVKVLVVPVGFRATNRATSRLLSTLEATYVAAGSTLEDGAVIDDFNGAVTTSGLQFAVALEYPVARSFALTLSGRVIAFVPDSKIEATAIVDEFSQIRVRGTLTAEDVVGSYNVIAGMAFYSRLFRFRVGAGYGRFIVPEFGFVYLETGAVIDVAAYFRF